MATKLTPYKKLIALTKEAATELMAIPRAFEQKTRATYEIAKIDADLATRQQKLNEMCSKYPVPFDDIIDAIDEIALIERRKGQFATIIAEMFPDDSVDTSAGIPPAP